jgi:YcaO-like protein with predicted kinase domain
MLSDLGGLGVAASLSDVAAACGITRLATMTGLDRVGYPVAAAIRPLSRNLSVSMGKGPTLAQARVSAVMEAAELFFSEKPQVDVVQDSYRQLGERTALDPSIFAASDAPLDLSEQPFAWIRGKRLSSGQPLLVPWPSVSMDLSTEAAASVFASGATGLAAAFDETEAQLHGLCEVIERDCHNSWNGLGDEARVKTLVDPSIEASPALALMLEQIENAGLHLFVWDMTRENRLPCYLAEVLDFADGAPTSFAQGSAAHIEPGRAIEKAIAEALQVRLTYISGSRDDLDWSDYGDRFKDVVSSRQWLSDLRLPRSAPGQPTVDTARTPEKTVQRICEWLWQSDRCEVIAARLSPEDAPAAVVKVVVPGLQDTPDANFFEQQRRHSHDD